MADVAAAAVRRRNARDCLTQLLDDPCPLTVAELSARSGLSRPTVEAVLQDLIEAGTVHGIDPSEKNAPGRPARRFAAAPADTLVAGLDITPDEVRCALADAAGRIVARTRTQLAPGGPDERLDAIAGAVTAAVRGRRDHDHHQDLHCDHHHDHHNPANGVSPQPRLAAVGLAVPGILDHDHRLARSDAMPELAGMDLGAALSRRLGCTVDVENDLKLTTYAEHHVAQTPDNLIFVGLGRTISVAIMIEGRILQGSHRMAGELSAQRGMRWTESSDDDGLLWSTGRDAQPLFDRAAAGDRRAIAEIDHFCAQIAPRLASLVLTLDPETVIVGGGLSRSGRVLLDPLRRRLDEQLTAPAAPNVVAARLTGDGAVTGALGHAFDLGSKQIFGIAEMPPPWCRLRSMPGSLRQPDPLAQD